MIATELYNKLGRALHHVLFEGKDYARTVSFAGCAPCWFYTDAQSTVELAVKNHGPSRLENNHNWGYCPPSVCYGLEEAFKRRGARPSRGLNGPIGIVESAGGEDEMMMGQTL